MGHNHHNCHCHSSGLPPFVNTRGASLVTHPSPYHPPTPPPYQYTMGETSRLRHSMQTWYRLTNSRRLVLDTEDWRFPPPLAHVTKDKWSSSSPHSPVLRISWMWQHQFRFHRALLWSRQCKHGKPIHLQPKCVQTCYIRSRLHMLSNSSLWVYIATENDFAGSGLCTYLVFEFISDIFRWEHCFVLVIQLMVLYMILLGDGGI